MFASMSQDLSGPRVRRWYHAIIRRNNRNNVEITVQEAGSGGPAPLVNLRGQGEVVRVEDIREEPGRAHAALKFTGALSLREPFAQMLLF